MVAVITTALIVSNTHMADAVMGAKQFGPRTAEMIKNAEFKQAFKKAQEQNLLTKQQDKTRDKGFKSPVEKISTIKKEQVLSDSKKSEQQKAIKIWETYYKKSWTG